MLTVTDLRCQYAVHPLAIDTARPRLSWVLQDPRRGQRQTAYQILAASSLEKLETGEADLWDSGKVSCMEILPVEYAGRPLASGEEVYWKIRAWDAQDIPGEYSEPGSFEVGLLNPEDWRADWVGFPGGWNGRALYFRNTFEVKRQVRKARAWIAALGYYELHLNGRKVGDHVLDPAVSDVGKRVYYVTYDVAPYLNEGPNAAGVIIGNGWFGSPRLLLQIRIDYVDGTSEWVVTGRQGQGGSFWRVTTGPILENSIYIGEVYDARLEKPGWDTIGAEGSQFEGMQIWSGAQVTESPGGGLKPQMVEPIRVIQTIPPRRMAQPAPGVYVFDMGQNFSGWALLRVRGPRGLRVILRYAEALLQNGLVNQENLRSAQATDIYILKGNGQETWEPRFTYHGFRYVQVEGYLGEPGLDSVQGRLVRSSTEPNGEFECGNALLNRIHQMVWWTEASNQHGIPTDCPQRDERMGWLNDMGARTEEALYNFNLSRFMPKWVADIGDAQDPVTGAISDTAPYRWGSRPADPVSVCYLLVPWQCYLHYGDLQVLKDNYQGMKRWVDYLTSRAEEHILSYSYYGDWSPPAAESISGESAVSKNTPGPLVSTAFHAYSARLFSKIAAILGCKEDEIAYADLSEEITEAYNRRFWDEAAGGYGSNNQACNSLSLYMGLVPENRKDRVLKNLVHDVMEVNDGHLTTGNLCTKYLLEALLQGGKGEVGYRVATQDSYPSWGNMIANGATTLWERWENRTGGGMNSHNHPMMGSVGSWLYKALAGITIDPDGPGFTQFFIRPIIPDNLGYARATLKTVRGLLEAAWKKTPDGLELRVTVPVGSRAQIGVPKVAMDGDVTIRESGQLAWQKGVFTEGIAGIEGAWEEGGAVCFQVGSGSYFFQS